MLDSGIIIYSAVLLFSLLLSIILGIIFLATKEFSDNKRKILGIILLAVGMLNFILFNLLVFKRFAYTIPEFVSLILLFLMPFVEGFVLLSVKEVKATTRKLFGVLLIIMSLFMIGVLIASA